MSSCLSGGGRAYRLELDIFKSPTTSWTSNSSSSSPSSTLSESSNSPLTISTRKPRTPRKRPNQTYNEAAAILSTAYPKIFPTKHKFTNSHTTKTPFLFEPSDLFMPFPVINSSEYVLLERPNSRIGTKGSNPFEKPCQSPGEINSQGSSFLEVCDEYEEDFDAESILDEEIEEGIDSIMGNLSMDNRPMNDSNSYSYSSGTYTNACCYGYPVGLGFDLGHGIRRELRAMRNVDEGDDWWRFPSVNVGDITQKFAQIPVNKKKKNVEKKSSESAREESFPSTIPNKEKSASKESIPQPNAGLLLKLNYDNIMNAWSDKGSPFYSDAPGAESARNDVQARLEQIDLFPENRGGRGAIVLRSKEKQRTRVSSKKIGYQVRKVNANRRPKTKGKVVRVPTSPNDEPG
ncbi:protein CHLOROPLAST IMPORT APPARATUS 2 [Sesamum alatum]|uniref:Protein CHLOROPLAST IMPORT APPARATUS 2 n=1 Tax=Sesamum alatum TaxID=300844 RepID=A0AAE1YML6_9LAMI|nr:protein CHLOROPLAST IMPORT APPARATUS 2 [Sesamum alatum]